MASASSASSSVMSQRNYGVFLSFRGPDSRNTIVSHLHHALRQKGIHTFKDSEELEAGQRRSELFDAIEGSRVAVVTFSERYANSKWCLDELTKVMARKKEGKIDVIPIFYRVSPGEVRLHEKDKGVKGCYQTVMEEMGKRYGHDSETVKGWRKALWEGGDLIGFPLPEGEDEGKVVQKVVEKVLKILNRVPLEVAKYPVGISSRLEEIKPLLCMDPYVDDVHMIGIHGAAGGGKTTLSKAICNDLAHHFDAWCFLPNVRETSGTVNGLVLLQQMILRELSDQKEPVVSSIDAGKVLIRERLCHKRVLLILDDVDHLCQLDALAGNIDWFGNGSRVIITTRDSHVLTSGRVRCVVPVRLLDKDEADNLFRCHAFDESKGNIAMDRVLIDRFLAYADRLPLALVVIGSFLCGRSAFEWGKTLEKLDRNPNKTINSVLRVSFDGLDDQEKEIFLDIACFFKGSDVIYVTRVLDACGFVASIGISRLIERCLVEVEDGALQMHDLLEAMGKSICLDEKKIGIPSRIWEYEDFRDVFTEHVDSYNLKGIVLNLASKEKKLQDRSTFKDLKELQLLIVRNAFDPPEGSLDLPGRLKWFEWLGYSATAITFRSSRGLVGLEMQGSRIKKINVKELDKLKYLNLNHCESLDELPHLSESSNLIHLDLSYCNLKNLEFLNDLTCFTTLTHLCFSGNGLEKVPECISKFQKLEELWLRDCQHLRQVPDLPNLVTIIMAGCRNLQTFQNLHTFFCQSPRRFYADFSGCSSLDPTYINRSLPLERIRELEGVAEVIVPGEEIPIWMNQDLQFGSTYRVHLPVDVSKDDILGLALCLTFKVSSQDKLWSFLATSLAGHVFHRRLGNSERNCRESAHTWFVYVPRQPLSEEDVDIAAGMDWSNITFAVLGVGIDPKRCGSRVICRREQDEERLVVQSTGLFLERLFNFWRVLMTLISQNLVLKGQKGENRGRTKKRKI